MRRQAGQVEQEKEQEEEGGTTHVIQTGARMRNLNELQTRRHALGIVVALGLQCLRNRLLARLLQTEAPVARLIESLDQTDIEAGDVGAQPKVDVCNGGGVRSSELDGSAFRGPCSAIVDVFCFRDVGTRVDPLGDAGPERAATPFGVIDCEVGRCQSRQREKEGRS